MPFELLSNQGLGFRAELLEYLCDKMQIKHNCTNPYYPHCNGLNERLNGELIEIPTKVTEHQGKN